MPQNNIKINLESTDDESNLLASVCHVMNLQKEHPVLKEHNGCIEESLIDMIEELSPEEIRRRLRAAGILRRSRSDKDYRRAKELIFRGMSINSAIYDQHISVIIDYIGE